MAEAVAMLRALAEDATRDASLDVTLLVDEERCFPLPANRAAARVRRVPAGAEIDALVEEAARADWTLVVAPETGGLLAARVEAVRLAGGRPAACGGRFIRVAGDKQATVTALAAAGVPVPAGRLLADGAPLPAGFHLPAVCKARDGVGCAGLAIVPRSEDFPAAAGERRVEAFVPGMPVGVSCLCGPAGIKPLPPVGQRFSGGASPRYLGGSVDDVGGWRPRAAALAVRAVDAVARAAGGATPDAAAGGWVGVDMILGPGEDECGDRVLEVNPRLTTSFVGLAAAVRPQSLVRLLLDTAAGWTPALPTWRDGAIEFDVGGITGTRDARSPA